MEKTCAQAILDCLSNHGVAHIFSIASGKMMPLIKALSTHNAITFTGTRHEANAAMMATGVYLASGQVACAMGELGPGGTNLIPGVANAFSDNVPLIVLTTGLPLNTSLPERGVLMDIDLMSLFEPITKANFRILDGRRAPEVMNRAVRAALTGRPGPVHINVPADILAQIFNYDRDGFTESARVFPDAPYPSPHAIKDAAALLKSATRPLLLAGGGVIHSDASEAFTALADTLGAPATTTQMGLGSISSNHPSFIGHGGAIGSESVVKALTKADVVVAVGCRFSSWLWDKERPLVQPPTKVIHIDIDPEMIGKLLPVEVAIQADAKAALTSLITSLGAEGPKSHVTAWRDDLHTEYKAWCEAKKADSTAKMPRGVMHPAAVTYAMADLMPEDAIVTYDGGHTSFWHNSILPAHEPRTRLHAPGLAQLGCGTAYAIGIKRAMPGRTVICTTGDGSFGFTLQDLDTARRYGLPVIFLIHNNEAWGVIRKGQEMNGFEFATDLSGTDYAAIARGFGCNGALVRNLKDFRKAFAEALTSDLPTVLDCRTSFEPHPAMKFFGGGTVNPPMDAKLPY